MTLDNIARIAIPSNWTRHRGPFAVIVAIIALLLVFQIYDYTINTSKTIDTIIAVFSIMFQAF